ncbi:MAG: hypothetical protein ACI97A_001076 [Planctomycetota bacterium]|jgi:hypothetical protein
MKLTILTLLVSVVVISFLSAQTPLPLRHEIVGSQLFGSIGQKLGRVPDINGDGADELIVSATPLGKVFVYSGADATLLLTLSTSGVFDNFGTSVCGISDVNTDGVPDLVVGAPGDDTAGIDAGRVDVLSGADGTLIFSAFGDFSEDFFGTSVASIEDLNNDSTADFLVGAPGSFSSGFVRAHSGADGSTISTFFGPNPGSGMGWRVAAIDDIDGDGLQEVASVAIHAANTLGDLQAGRLFVIAGSGLALLLDVAGLAANDHFGFELSALKDVNGDDKGDLLVSAPNDARGGPDAGSAQIISGADGTVLSDMIGQQPFALFGSAVADAGDVNGDGITDVVIGAKFHDGFVADSGLVSVRNGADGTVIEDFSDFESSTLLGASLVGLGDVDGDGFDDFAMGKPNANGPSFLVGIVRVISVGGTRKYGAVNAPAASRGLSWICGPFGDRTSGSIVLDGASPFDIGVVAASFAPADMNFSGLPILINTAPTLLAVEYQFLYALDGTATFATSIKNPFLTGIRAYVQGFDAQFPYGATNGIEIRHF